MITKEKIHEIVDKALEFEDPIIAVGYLRTEAKDLTEEEIRFFKKEVQEYEPFSKLSSKCAEILLGDKTPSREETIKRYKKWLQDKST